MTATWRFDDFTFDVLWEHVAGEELPAPLIHTSRTTDYLDYLRERREAVECLKARWDRSFDRVAEVIKEPDLLLAVSGFDGRDPRRAEGCVRLLGLRRRDQGFVIQQLPGETYVHSGGFVVTECDPVRLADAVSQLLPECEPGRLGNVELADESADDSVDREYGRSVVGDNLGDSANLRRKRFLETPMSCVGAIDVVQGSSKYGPRGITQFQLRWCDLEDDGRYVIGGEPPFVAVSADALRLTSMINARVAAVVQAIKDERA
ncbi:ESX secretion-associated protein EspG [Nocardia tengchongensis]|uniref:ESX secretion-associated protein EspG n=1 Tax=Nocardia tengchongensis TaxID=2055889 RepID=UPI00367A70AF